MDLRLPMIVSREGGRLLRCWLPHWPGLEVQGVSLSELRDDLALLVMERFEATPAAEAWRWQLAPHSKLKHVRVDTVARDQEDGRAYRLKGRLAVLLEKWPDDDFWVATPTRAPALAFALRGPDELEVALLPRVKAFCLEHRIETLDDWHSARDQRLDVLEVDADPKSILPRGQRPAPRRKAKPTANAKDSPAAPHAEADEEREQRRARARLSVRTLRQIGKNLAHQARDGVLGSAFGREGLAAALLELLERREGAAIVLVGPSGAGKTALVHEVTRRLVERQQGTSARRDVWRIDGNQFIAGMSYVGQWEARARELCDELIDTGDVLYVDDLASLVYAGRHRKGDTHLAQYLEPHLGRGELTVFAECTPERFERVREEAPSFAALFDVVQVAPLTGRETLPVLLGTVRALESEAAVAAPRIPPDVMELVLELSGRFFAHQALPGRAVRLIHRVLAGPGVLEGASRRYRAADVYEAVRRETGLPDFILGGAPPKRREEIVAELSAQVAGQPEAIDAVSDAVLALQASVQDPDKPLANLLFVGPTGVGKTETAKALARYLFGSTERLVRFDMSELAHPGAIGRLVGEAGGAEGELVTALRTQPFCVVLLDEVEKAHPRVFDALLQFLGEGRLSDANGHPANGRNAVVVMTSNLGVREAASQAGFARAGAATAAQHYLSAARAFFRPELFNRLDRVVPFRSLEKDALRRVVEHALAELLSRRGLRRGNVLVDVEPELLELLVDQAFDPRFGARPLKRLLERRLAVPLAHHLLRRDVEELAVIELLRQGDEPQLSVRLLAPAAKVEASAPGGWTLGSLTAAVHAAQQRAQTALRSPRAERLRRLRAEALASGAPVGRAGRVLDGLEALAGRLEALTDGALEPTAYEERMAAPPKSLFVRARIGLRPRPEPRSELYTMSPEALVTANAPVLVGALDELELLEHQLDASERPDETATLLLDTVGPPSPEAVAVYAEALPALGVAALGETAAGWGDAVITAQFRRRAYVFHGPGVRALTEPSLGYARIEVAAEDGGTRRALVRAVRLDGGDGSPAAALEVIAAHDAKVRAEREARRAGGPAPEDPFPRVVFERDGGPGAFTATGLAPTGRLAHLAACLRARKAGR